jgi:hypothetical protein
MGNNIFIFLRTAEQNLTKLGTSRSHYGSKVPVVTVTVFKYRNKIGKQKFCTFRIEKYPSQDNGHYKFSNAQ